MVKSQYNKTPEQEEFCNNILNKKYIPRKPKCKPTVIEEKKLTRIDYMNNCIFWINEYLCARTSIDGFNKAIYHLEEHIRLLKNEHHG